MKSKVVKLPILVLSILAIALAACGGDGETTDECTDPTPNKCQDGNCHECCIDDDCPSIDYICNDEFACELLCKDAGDDCSKDANSCCDGLSCDIFTNECMTSCTGDGDCTSRTEIDFAGDLKCKNGRCDFDHCTRDATCEPGQACFNGDCVTIPECSEVASCRVLPGSAVTQNGTEVQLSAAAFLTSGALAPGMSFTWESDAGTVASVGGGLVTGGADSGTATITATVASCTTTCDATITNYGDVTGGTTRVVVVDELAGTPIAGATVVVGGEAAATTDALGIVEAAVVLNQGNPGDITVTKEDYNYVTMREVEVNDVIVHMGELYQFDFSGAEPKPVAGGIKGKFDHTLVPCEEGHTCDVLIGLGGLSIPGNLVNLNFDLLIGGLIKTYIELGGTKEEVPLPSGLTLALNQTAFREFYTPTGVPGTRVAWGLGGKLDLSVLIEMLGPIISGGDDIDVGAIVAGLLPLFGEFYTAMVPNVDIVPRDLVLDTEDIDDDPDTTHVPDYDNFPGQNMALKVGMTESLTVTPPTLPALPGGDGYYYDGVIVLAGVIVRGAGLVPLGLSAGLDSQDADDPADGTIDDPIVVKVADVAGRIPEEQVQRVIVSLALSVSGLTGSSDQEFALAGQVKFVDTFSGTHNLGALTTPAVGTYDEASRTLSMTEVPDSSYHQVIFTAGDEINWQVVGEFATGDYTLPAAPAEGDRAKSASFIAINLKDGLTYQDLAAFNSTNLADLVELVDSFVFTDMPDAP